jgi:hypothetical protein
LQESDAKSSISYQVTQDQYAEKITAIEKNGNGSNGLRKKLIQQRHNCFGTFS